MMRRRTASSSLWNASKFAVALLFSTSALAQTEDHAPVDLQSAAKLAQDDSAGNEAWTYINPNAGFPKYRTVIVEPTVVYDGPDAQFENVSQNERLQFAQIMTNALRSEIGKSFPAPAKAKKDTLVVRLSLLGAQKTKGGIATATRVTPIGFGLSAAKSVLGKQGTFTGSVLYAVEVFDGTSNTLLLSAVRRRTPDPLDIPATLSTTETVQAVARDFAVSARKRLENMTGKR